MNKSLSLEELTDIEQIKDDNIDTKEEREYENCAEEDVDIEPSRKRWKVDMKMIWGGWGGGGHFRPFSAKDSGT